MFAHSFGLGCVSVVSSHLLVSNVYNKNIQIQYKRAKLRTVHIQLSNFKHCPAEIKQNCHLDVMRRFHLSLKA
jgi:hypothetical protein